MNMDILALGLNKTFLCKRNISVSMFSQLSDLPVEHTLKLICLTTNFSLEYFTGYFKTVNVFYKSRIFVTSYVHLHTLKGMNSWTFWLIGLIKCDFFSIFSSFILNVYLIKEYYNKNIVLNFIFREKEL